MSIAPAIDIRRSDDRFHTRAGWLDSKHSFSFGGHYSPDNTHHGQLLVLNDDRVAGGTGFDTHPHRDMEIVTWVLDGELEHKDSEGNRGLIYPGLAQRMSAGRGIWHSEKNWSATDEVHFIQMWVLPDTESIDPGYQQLDINDQLDGGGLVPIASGQGHDAAISIHQRDAVLWGARLQPGDRVAGSRRRVRSRVRRPGQRAAGVERRAGHRGRSATDAGRRPWARRRRRRCRSLDLDDRSDAMTDPSERRRDDRLGATRSHGRVGCAAGHLPA